jgi:multicomponent K+:H+ antiporter subunit A
MEVYRVELRLPLVSQLFLLLVLVVRVLILLYSRFYLSEEFNFGYYLLMMFTFIVRMVGLLVASNWVTLILR